MVAGSGGGDTFVVRRSAGSGVALSGRLGRAGAGRGLGRRRPRGRFLRAPRDGRVRGGGRRHGRLRALPDRGRRVLARVLPGRALVLRPALRHARWTWRRPCPATRMRPATSRARPIPTPSSTRPPAAPGGGRRSRDGTTRATTGNTWSTPASPPASSSGRTSGTPIAWAACAWTSPSPATPRRTCSTRRAGTSSGCCRCRTTDGGAWHKLTSARFGGFVLPERDDGGPRLIVRHRPRSLQGHLRDRGPGRGRGRRRARLPALRRRLRPALARGGASRLRLGRAESRAGAFRNCCGIVTGEYGDDRCEDETLWAAAELFRTTGEAGYGEHFLRAYAPGGPAVSAADYPQDWRNVKNMALWAYAVAAGADAAAREVIRTDTLAAADAIVARTQASGYRVSLRPEHYVWGSNGGVANFGLLLLIADAFSPDRRYVQAALDNLHYLLGRNTHGVSFVTGVGTRPVRRIHHRPSGADAQRRALARPALGRAEPVRPGRQRPRRAARRAARPALRGRAGLVRVERKRDQLERGPRVPAGGHVAQSHRRQESAQGRLDLHVPVAHLVAVVLEQDVALDLRAEAGHVLELALGDGRLQLGAAELVFEDLRAVEPVLDVVAAARARGSG